MARKFTFQVEVVVDEDPHPNRFGALARALGREFEDFLTGRQFNVQGTHADPGTLGFVVQSVYVQPQKDKKRD